jgi:hypothetical protein
MEPFDTSGAPDERLASSRAAASTIGSRIMDGLDAMRAKGFAAHVLGTSYSVRSTKLPTT